MRGCRPGHKRSHTIPTRPALHSHCKATRRGSSEHNTEELSVSSGTCWDAGPRTPSMTALGGRLWEGLRRQHAKRDGATPYGLSCWFRSGASCTSWRAG